MKPLLVAFALFISFSAAHADEAESFVAVGRSVCVHPWHESPDERQAEEAAAYQAGQRCAPQSAQQVSYFTKTIEVCESGHIRAVVEASYVCQ